MHNIKLSNKPITLTFPSHGLIGIYGKSGCGKTTLLYILTGLISCEGEIVREGEYSFIRQNYDLLSYLTVKDNILSECSLLKEKYNPYYFHQLVEKMELTRLLKKYPYELSVGQVKKVSIARSLIRQVPIILCDEPTGALHHKQAQEVMELLKEASQYSLVILVSHDISLLNEYVDDLYHLEDNLTLVKHKDIGKKKEWGKATKRAHVHFVYSSIKYHKKRYLTLIIFQCFMMLFSLILSTGLYSLDKTYQDHLLSHPLRMINIVEEKCNKGIFLFEKGNFPPDILWYVLPRNKKHIILKDGRFPLNKDEVVASDTIDKKMISYELEGHHLFHVVGYYHEIQGTKRVFVSDEFYRYYPYYSHDHHVVEGDYHNVKKKYPHLENEWILEKKSIEILWKLAQVVFRVFFIVSICISFFYIVIVQKGIYEERRREIALMRSILVTSRVINRKYKGEMFLVSLSTSIITCVLYYDLLCINYLFSISEHYFHFSLYFLPPVYYVFITLVYLGISLIRRVRTLSNEKIVSLLREDI